MLVSTMPSAMSERCVEHVVDVTSERNGIDRGQSLPAATEFVERHGRARQSGELCDRLARIGDGQLLAALGALDDLAALFSQLTDRDVGHVRSVSRVI